MHVDWPRLLGDLQYLWGELDDANPELRTPIGLYTLATRLGRPRSTIRNWIDGARPKHDEGEWLIALWVQHTGKPRQFLPVCKPVLSSAAFKDRG